LSEELVGLIAAKLGHPTRDPHGDPIPSPDLRLEEPPTVPLDAVPVGTLGRFVRISDTDPAMLRYLDERGIAPGDEFEVVDREPFDGPLLARFGADVQALGGALVRAMRVEVRHAP
jgi:DtxR family transcriptional regulator, Mn-dependent transcriptional regulator